MAKDLSNYFDDWTRVYCNYGRPAVQAMCAWCLGRFGHKGLIWEFDLDVIKNNPSLPDDYTQKYKSRYFFRFKNSDDAMLFRLKFAEYLC